MSNIQNNPNRQAVLNFALNNYEEIYCTNPRISLTNSFSDDLKLIDSCLDLSNNREGVFIKTILIPYCDLGGFGLELAKLYSNYNFILTCEHQNQYEAIKLQVTTKNVTVCLEEPGYLTSVDSNSIDAILLFEGYSNCIQKSTLIKEIKRVSKSSSKLLIVDFSSTSTDIIEPNYILQNDIGIELENVEITRSRISQQEFILIDQQLNLDNAKKESRSFLSKDRSLQDLDNALTHLVDTFPFYALLFKKA